MFGFVEYFIQMFKQQKLLLQGPLVDGYSPEEVIAKGINDPNL